MTRANSTGGQNRRTFMKRAAALGGLCLAAGTRLSLGTARAAAAAWTDQIGVQLYTVRDKMQEDFEGTLEQVAQMGYKEVEFAGYYDHTPEQVRQLLDRLNLRAPSAHIGLENLRADREGQLQAALAIGHEYVTVPALPGAFGGQLAPDAWPGIAEEFNELGAACKEKGLRFAYHNHAFEFAPADKGKTGYEVLLTETDPELVAFEMDLMWTIFAGQDPLAWFEQHPGRFVMWHVKDMKGIKEAQAASNEGQGGGRAIFEHIAAVGEGDIDFARIFAQAEQSGLQHFFVENDAPKDSLANIKTSYANLEKLLAQG